MFERFSDQARRMIVLAQQECRRLGHDHVDAGHVLLALLLLPQASGTRLLVSCGADLDALAGDTERTLGPGSRPRDAGGHLPFHPQTKRVLEVALREALGLGHDYIGTEHLLLALVVVEGTAASRALTGAGMRADAIREAARRTPSTERQEPRGSAEPIPAGAPTVLIQELIAARTAKDAALDRRDFEAAANFRDKERDLLRRMHQGEAG
jgi:ATP-dependent Clp protease ATP-binding subunit ClpC